MVINASELDLDGLLWAILGIAGFLLTLPVAIALVTTRLGGRHFGILSLSLGFVIAIAVLVEIVVVWRTVGGEVTGWDLLWAGGLAGVGLLSGQQLFPSAQRSDPR